MNFSFYIAKRYLISKSSKSAINIITIIATVGVIVSSLVLFILLSGFSGLRTFSYSLLDASDPDIKITASKGKSFVFDTKIEKVLKTNSNIALYAKVVEERVFAKHNTKSLIASLKGVPYHYNKIIAIDSILSVGTWLDSEFSNTAVIGNGISYKLSIGIANFGEALQLTIPKSGKGFLNPNNAFNSGKAQVIGTFGGTEEFQNKYIFTNLALAQKLLNYTDNQITAIELKLSDNELANVVRDELQTKLGEQYVVKTKEQLNSLFYKVINTENFIGYLIGTLITIIALFNILGSIIMMIIEKRENLKTLTKLGVTIFEIKRIFVFQGFLLTLLGMCIGLSISIPLVLLQEQYGFLMITHNIPYPVEFRWLNLVLVIFTISILGYLAVKIASSRINEQFLHQ